MKCTSQTSKQRSTHSNFHDGNGHNESNEGCSKHLHFVTGRDDVSDDDLSVRIAKKREIGGERAVSASQSTLQDSSCTISHLLELASITIKLANIGVLHIYCSSSEGNSDFSAFASSCLAVACPNATETAIEGGALSSFYFDICFDFENS